MSSNTDNGPQSAADVPFPKFLDKLIASRDPQPRDPSSRDMEQGYSNSQPNHGSLSNGSESDLETEEDHRVLRALAADNDDVSDASSTDDAQLDAEHFDDTGKVPPSGLLPPQLNKSLSASSSSILGKLTSGLSAALSRPPAMMRSPRVGVAPCEPEPVTRPASAASTTRTPSPDNFFWRPIMPGYKTTDIGLQSTTVVQQTVQVELQTETEKSKSARDDGLQLTIAVMPMLLAIVCCFLNCISPGLGTFMSGLSLMCCSRPQNPNTDRSNLVLLNMWLALLQLITVIFFLAGWIWSIVWGIAFITISNSSYNESSQDDADTNTNRDVNTLRHDDDNRTTTTATTRTTTMTTTTTQSTLSSDNTDNCSGVMNNQPEQPIIVLQETPVILQPGLTGWVSRPGPLPPVIEPDYRRGSAQLTASSNTRPSAGPRTSSLAQPVSRRQRITQRRQNASQRAVDHLTGVLLSPEALEHIVIHSSVVPDPQYASSSTGGSASIDVTLKTS